MAPPSAPSRRRLPAALLLLLALLVGVACDEKAAEDGGPAAKDPPEEGFTLPAWGALNADVVKVLATYPKDGTHRYHWPKEGPWLGLTRTLVYDGETVGAGDPEGRCYCCGLTFEVFFRAWERWCRREERPFVIGNLDVAGVKRLVRAWFGSNGDRTTVLGALEGFGLGARVEDWEAAEPGDFVQLWRHSGSGHSCVFLAWLRDEEGRIQGLRYWSTQSSTNGIGIREERFGEEGASLDRDAFHLARVGRPAPGEDRAPDAGR